MIVFVDLNQSSLNSFRYKAAFNRQLAENCALKNEYKLLYIRKDNNVNAVTQYLNFNSPKQDDDVKIECIMLKVLMHTAKIYNTHELYENSYFLEEQN